MKFINTKTFKLSLLALVLIFGLGLNAAPAAAMDITTKAECDAEGGDWVSGGIVNGSPTFNCINATGDGSVNLEDTTADCKDATELEGNCIVRRMVDIINFLSIGIGIIAVGMIIWAGIEYTVADANPQRVASAKSHILNVVVGLISYIFLYTLLNFLIPGGLIG